VTVTIAAGSVATWWLLAGPGSGGDGELVAGTTTTVELTTTTPLATTSQASTTTTEPVTTTQPTTTTTLVPEGFAVIEWGPGGPKVGLPIDWDPSRGTAGDSTVTAELVGQPFLESYANPGVLIEWWVGPDFGYNEEIPRLWLDRSEQVGVNFINDLQCDRLRIPDASDPTQWSWHEYIEGASIGAIYEIWADCDEGTELALIMAIGPSAEAGSGEMPRYRIFIQEEADRAVEILRVILDTFDPGSVG
jgi:hypothetical protein